MNKSVEGESRINGDISNRTFSPDLVFQHFPDHDFAFGTGNFQDGERDIR